MLNLLQISFLLFSLVFFFIGVLVNWFSSYIPITILKLFRYGKFSLKQSVPLTIQVPKRWYRHFYIFSSIWSLLGLYVMYSAFTGKYIPSDVTYFLSIWRTNTGTGNACGYQNITSPHILQNPQWKGVLYMIIIEMVPASVSFLAMALLVLQSLRRLYETYFVSVYSDAEIDISHYILGLIHYFEIMLAILCEAPGIIYPHEKYAFSYEDIGFRHIAGTFIFLWATRNQFKCAEILGNLRKNKEGEVVTNKYKIPHGGYFDLVSCPHNFFEVVIYISLFFILWGNETWPFVTLWVIVNQMETAYLSHQWYKKTFKDYPMQRKALIPFLV